MQIDLIPQPWVDRSPESRPAVLVESLLNHAQPFVVFPVQRAGAVHRMVAAVGHAVVGRPLFGPFCMVAHKKKKRPQLSLRPPGPPYFLKNLQSFIMDFNVLEQIVPVSSNLNPLL